MCRTAVLAALVSGILIASPLTSGPVKAAFPGENGRIAFTRDDGTQTDIYAVHPDGTAPVQLTTDEGDDCCPVYSADAERIAFFTNRDGNDEVYTMNADGSGQTNVSDDPAKEGKAAWSPGGTKLAFTSNRDGNFEIWVSDPDGSNPTQLTETDNGVNLNPSWSPHGTKIAFETNRDGNLEVYVMNANGSAQTNISKTPTADDGDPDWSPDGTQIAYHSDRAGNFDIFVMDADGFNQENLTQNPARDLAPVFSPDGDYIAFQSSRDGNDQIYTVDTSNLDVFRVTTSPFNDTMPDWAPVLPPDVFVVNSVLDSIDSDTADGFCRDAVGACTIRAAVMQANSRPGEDTIHIPAGEYSLSIEGSDEDAALSGDLDITDALVIEGSTTGTAGIVDLQAVVVSDTGDRVFHVAGGVHLDMFGVVFRGGIAHIGGGMLIEEDAGVDLDHVRAIQNEALDPSCAGCGTGGGIHNSGTLTAIDSTIAGNEADGAAGLMNQGDASLTRTTVSGGHYGSIVNGPEASLSLANSTVAANQAGQNVPDQAGTGGILSFGELTVEFSTITGNGINFILSGGLAILSGAAEIRGTIISGNIGAQCSGEIISLGYNLSSDDTCGFIAEGDLTGIDPRLDDLGPNGGPTSSHALRASSPAIDAAGDDCPDTDQRGVGRPQGPACDIGAFEAPPQPRGDTDCDGDIDSVDALNALKDVAGQDHDASCIVLADTDCDGDRDAVDALGILRHIAALPPLPKQPGCPPVGPS